MGELDKKHKKEVEDKVESVKRSISNKADMDFRGHEEIFSEPGGVMDFEEERVRPKRVYAVPAFLSKGVTLYHERAVAVVQLMCLTPCWLMSTKGFLLWETSSSRPHSPFVL
ncbi:COP9 signalosome complex subunit 7-like protein [Drosera capensis]